MGSYVNTFQKIFICDDFHDFLSPLTNGESTE